MEVEQMGKRLTANDSHAFHGVDPSLTVCTMNLVGIISKSWRGPGL